MKKIRLPKPAATNVVIQHLYLGSVYTADQMRKFAEKSVLAERLACANICSEMYLDGDMNTGFAADAITARGQQ